MAQDHAAVAESLGLVRDRSGSPLGRAGRAFSLLLRFARRKPLGGLGLVIIIVMLVAAAAAPLIAASVITTAILTPILTSWVAKRQARQAGQENKA